MLYLTPNENKAVTEIYDYIPDEPYVVADGLPPRPVNRNGFYLQLFADIETGKAWWDYMQISASATPLPDPDLEPALAPPPPDPIADLARLVVEQEYRLTLLELGVM